MNCITIYNRQISKIIYTLLNMMGICVYMLIFVALILIEKQIQTNRHSLWNLLFLLYR